MNLRSFKNECLNYLLKGFHVCLTEAIEYKEKVPTGGPHRPVWVTYGDYVYMPPKRWLHAIEHGKFYLF